LNYFVLRCDLNVGDFGCSIWCENCSDWYFRFLIAHEWLDGEQGAVRYVLVRVRTNGRVGERRHGEWGVLGFGCCKFSCECDGIGRYRRGCGVEIELSDVNVDVVFGCAHRSIYSIPVLCYIVSAIDGE